MLMKIVFHCDKVEISVTEGEFTKHAALDKKWSHVFRRRKCIMKNNTEAGRPFSLKKNTESAFGEE